MSFSLPAILTPREFLSDFLVEAQKAKKRIWLQSMNYDPSEETQQIEPILVAKAKNGVDVRLTHDWVTTRFYDHSFDMFPWLHFFSMKQRTEFNQQRKNSLQRIKAAGGKVAETNLPTAFQKVLPIAGRNHIKMYIVDDIAWMGGVNLVVDGFDNVDAMIKITDQNFVEALRTQYERVNQNRPKTHYQKKLDDDHELILDNGKQGSSLIYDIAMKSIDAAQKEICLYSQIMPTGRLLSKLLNKTKQGVKVHFITSNKEDSVFTTFPENIFYAYFVCRTWLNPRFSTRYLNQKLHLKLLIIDDKELFFGSHNLSEVGVQLGTEEIMLHARDRKLVHAFRAIFG